VIRAAHIPDHQPPVISLNHPDQTGRILLATDTFERRWVDQGPASFWSFCFYNSCR
jgi:hypothetical protein